MVTTGHMVPLQQVRTEPRFLRGASRHELSLLRFPEPETTWVVVMKVALNTDVSDIDDRLHALSTHVPVVAARLRGEDWWTDEAPTALHATGDPLGHPDALRRFDLAHESPVRVIVGNGELVLSCEHAAFDGLAMVAMLRFLLGGEVPSEAVSAPAGPPDGMRPYLERIARPAHVAARSIVRPDDDVLVAAPVRVRGRQVTGRATAACAAAVGRHNRRAGQPFDRIGITVPIAGPIAGMGNVAGYRRIDVAPSDDIVGAVVEAMASPQEPQLQVRSTRYLKLTAPLVPRLSDSLLVSNLGRHSVPGVRRIDFYPVARGSSAVAFGLCSLEGGQTTLALRARYLDKNDATAMLDDAIGRIESSG